MNALRVGGRAELCTVCGERFSNTRAGDRHRTGSHGVLDGPARRRSRTRAEMLAAGLVLNGRGVWTLDRP